MFYKINALVLHILMFFNFYASENFKGINQMNKSFLTQDILGNSVILECEEIIGKTKILGEKIKSISNLLIPTYTKQEVEFIRKNTKVFTAEEITNDFMIRSLHY